MSKEYSVLFVGDYFSMNTNITSMSEDIDIISEEATLFMQDFYGWDNLSDVSNQIIIRDLDGTELGEV